MPKQGPPVVTGQTVDTYAIVGFQFNKLDTHKPTARFVVARGTMVDGSFSKVDQQPYRIPLEELIAEFSKKPTEPTRYADVKAALYAYAQKKGYIPAEATDV